MKTVVYLIKNIVNGKIYVGVHDMEDPTKSDYYLGDGVFMNAPKTYNKARTPFQAAICKYGVKNFRRTILKVFNTRQEALNLEAQIVDENFIRLPNTYNITVGEGYPPRHDKKVYRYDLNGNLINEYPSIVKATEETSGYNGVIRKSIIMQTSFAGSFWSFEKVQKLNIENYIVLKYRTRIKVYNKDLELLNEFESINSAAKAYNFLRDSIANAILEKGTLHGLYFIPDTTTIEDFIKSKDKRVYTSTTRIYQYDKNKDFIKEFKSVSEARKELNLKSHSRIISAIKTEKLYHDFYWSYFKEKKFPNFTEIPSKPKKIEQLLNGKVIKVWNINECRKKYPNVIAVCRGIRKKTGGYEWRYTS